MGSEMCIRDRYKVLSYEADNIQYASNDEQNENASTSRVTLPCSFVSSRSRARSSNATTDFGYSTPTAVGQRSASLHNPPTAAPLSAFPAPLLILAGAFFIPSHDLQLNAQLSSMNPGFFLHSPLFAHDLHIATVSAHPGGAAGGGGNWCRNGRA